MGWPEDSVLPKGSGLWLLKARQGVKDLSKPPRLAKAGRVSQERVDHPLPKKV